MDGTAPETETQLKSDDSGRAILHQYEKAKSFMREGNWAEYGKAMDTLEKMLRERFGDSE